MYKDFVQKLKTLCTLRGFKIKKIGSVGKCKEFPMFMVMVNDGAPFKKTVCFSAGIHGEEPAGSYAVLRFLETCDPHTFKNVRVILFPVANPSGFDKGIRRNFLNKDLNGHFCHKKLTNENKILYEAIGEKPIFFFHALHEDEGLKEFYLYNFEKKEEKIYRDIIRLAGKYFPIQRKKKIYNDPAYGGLITNRKDSSFEDRMFRDGVPFSMCTETPEAQPFKKRVQLNVEIMNHVLKFTQYFNGP